MRRWAYPALQAGGDVSMHGTLHDCEEMDVILLDEKREEGECVTIAVALVEGKYERRLIMMEQHFEIKPDGRKPASKARVCMCPAVTVMPSMVVRPDNLEALICESEFVALCGRNKVRVQHYKSKRGIGTDG